MPVPWPCKLVFGSFLFQYAEACVDSSGDFYCTNLWYFWFCLFWLCMFIFVGVVCIVNRCTKKNRQVDVSFQLPPIRTPRNEGSPDKEPPPTTTTTAATCSRTDSSAA